MLRHDFQRIRISLAQRLDFLMRRLSLPTRLRGLDRIFKYPAVPCARRPELNVSTILMLNRDASEPGTCRMAQADGANALLWLLFATRWQQWVVVPPVAPRRYRPPRYFVRYTTMS
jgi:hypothetical protein